MNNKPLPLPPRARAWLELYSLVKWWRCLLISSSDLYARTMTAGIKSTSSAQNTHISHFSVPSLRHNRTSMVLFYICLIDPRNFQQVPSATGFSHFTLSSHKCQTLWIVLIENVHCLPGGWRKCEFSIETEHVHKRWTKTSDVDIVRKIRMTTSLIGWAKPRANLNKRRLSHSWFKSPLRT